MESNLTTRTGVAGFFVALLIAIEKFIVSEAQKVKNSVALIRKYIAHGTAGFGMTRLNSPKVAWRECKADMRIARMDDAGILDIIMTFAVAAIVIAIIVIVLATIDTAMPAINASSPYATVQSTVRTTTVSGLGLLVISLIIIAAVGLITILMAINRGGKTQ